MLYERLRGPRTDAELAVQEELFPRERAVPFTPAAAALAPRLYGALRRPRGREIDLAIARVRAARRRRPLDAQSRRLPDVPGLSQI